MKFAKFLEQWDLSKLKISAGFLEMEWSPRDEDRAAAWELYVELLTRVTTQRLQPPYGSERSAIASAHSLFSITREIAKRHGPNCVNFAKIAVVVLNQVVRPFTTKWHSVIDRSDLLSPDDAIEFRMELIALQVDLNRLARLLADMAGVEDLTGLETPPMLTQGNRS